MIKFLVYAWGEYRWLADVLAAKIRGTVTDWNFAHGGKFSAALRDELIGTEEPVVYLTPADQFPVELVPSLKNYAWRVLKKGNVLRLGVASDPAMETHGTKADEYKGRDVVRCLEWRHCSHAGGMGMDAALWNRALLASLLEPGWTMEDISVLRSNWVREHRPDLASEQMVPPVFRTVKLVDAARPKVVARLGLLLPEDRAAVLAALPGDWRAEE